jgi:hypothetical protein
MLTWKQESHENFRVSCKRHKNEARDYYFSADALLKQKIRERCAFRSTK